MQAHGRLRPGSALPLAATLGARIQMLPDAIALVIEMLLDAVTLGVEVLFATLATRVESRIDVFTVILQMLGVRLVAMGGGAIGDGGVVLLDAAALLVEILLLVLAALVEPRIDAGAAHTPASNSAAILRMVFLRMVVSASR